MIRARATFPLGKCTAAAPAASLVQIGVDSVDQTTEREKSTFRALFITDSDTQTGLRTAIRSVVNLDSR